MKHVMRCFREVHPHILICLMQNQVWMVAPSVECAPLLNDVWLYLPCVSTLRYFCSKPKRLVTKIPEGAISQICP
jgi:hypothetical protein